MREMNRRDFLKAASASSAAVVSVRAWEGRSRSRDVKISDTAYTPRADYPLRAIDYFDVTLTDDFWKPKVDRNAAVTIPFEVEKFVADNRPLNGNVLEAAMLSLRTHPDRALQAAVDAAVGALLSRPGRGNAGFEVAATYYRTTGRSDLVEWAKKDADALYEEFRRSDPPFSGGERDAINCLQLYKVTRDKKHLDLAKHYLDIRGLDSSVNRSRHNQSYKPVLEQSEAVGHAVNCASLMVSLVDVGVLTGLGEYFDAALRMWADAVARKMYITGGIGSTGNEGFGEPYSLPNISAYAETCAVLMFITLNHRMFLATGDSRYVDVMERGMYNNALDGVSLSGDRFFYVNRLASAGDGRDVRWARASLECCPPNLVRFLAGMPGLVYARDEDDTIYVNLYVASRATFNTGNGAITLSMDSRMPWSGASRISIVSAGGSTAAIKLRIPGWARNLPAPGGLYSYAEVSHEQPAIAVNGTAVGAAPDEKGYVTLHRTWQNGDTIDVEFPTPIRTVIADARVREARGRTAVERGTIVYCAEWPEAEHGRVLDLWLTPDRLTASVDPALLGGTTVIHATTRSMSRPGAPARPVVLIPYHLWANRGAGEMSVWLSKDEYAVGDIGPAGGFIFYINPAHEKDGWRYLEAAPADQSAGATWGCFRTAIAGARATAVGTGRQNTQDMLAACADRGTAADLCAAYRLNGVGGWFLPSRDELALMYRNLEAAGLGGFATAGAADNVSYWSSSQETADMASHVDFADNGRQHYDDKDFPRRVRAIRAF